MSVRHIHFEILCALAPTGDLSACEQAELRSHARSCGLCADRLAQFACLGSGLLLAEETRLGSRHALRGMQKRFKARALREGVPIQADNYGRRMNLALGLASSVLVAMLTIYLAMQSDSIFRQATQSMSTADPGKSVPLSTSLAGETPAIARPMRVGLRVHPHRRSSRESSAFEVPLTSRADAVLPRQFVLGRHSPWLTSSLSQPWNEMKPTDSPGLSGSGFAHPSFRFSVAVTQLSDRDSGTSLHLDARLSNTGSQLNLDVPRFHILQSTAD